MFLERELFQRINLEELCLRWSNFYEKTLVTFNQLTNQHIEYYIDKYKPYDKATNAIAEIIELNHKKLNIDSLAGGGDTVSAIKNISAEDGFNYLSNAGGAFLEWLEGNESPGVIALKENNFS